MDDLGQILLPKTSAFLRCVLWCLEKSSVKKYLGPVVFVTG